jgi:hypothetical protein
MALHDEEASRFGRRRVNAAGRLGRAREVAHRAVPLESLLGLP